LVAGAATAPFTLAFFNRLTPYDLISNLFEAPITGIVVMPSLFLGTVLSGTVFGVWLLKLAGFGLICVRFISDSVATLPGSVVVLPSAPAFVATLAMAGVLIICLVRGPVRWAGLAIALTILIWPRVKAPDVWIDAEGSNAAIRIGDSAYALRPTVKLYGYRQWLSHYGLKSSDIPPEDAEDAPSEAQTPTYAMTADYECKAYVCTPRPQARYKIGFAFGRKPLKPEIIERLCRTSELIISRSNVSAWPASCQKVNRLTADDFARLGSVELTRQDGQWLIKASMPLRGQRPWVNRVSDTDA
jgi:competence protein ComEC